MSTVSRLWKDLRQDVRRRVAAQLIDDRPYLSRLYHDAFGTAPDLDHPRGFNEKVLVKILTDRRPFLTLYSDKLRVRDVVRQRAPWIALPRLFWWSERAESLPLDTLPDAFVLKANHGSGWVDLVADKHQRTRLQLVRRARRWLASDFTIVAREWAYRNIRRAVYTEEFLGSLGTPPDDFKLFAFDGIVKLIQVDRDRFTRHTQVLYDEAWRPIEGSVAAPQGPPVPRPATLESMIAAAQALAAGVDFLRVDLYDIAGRVYFGELTHYPNKGLNPFRPASLDLLLGSWLTLDPTRGVALAYRPETYDEHCEAEPRAGDAGD